MPNTVPERYRTPELPFELHIATRTAPAHQVMRSESYEYVRKAALRRVGTSFGGRGKPEHSNQPTFAQVTVQGDVLFQIRRLVDETPSGKHLVRLVVDKDWRYEDSPFRLGHEYEQDLFVLMLAGV
jgi:hypothetical protein